MKKKNRSKEYPLTKLNPKLKQLYEQIPVIQCPPNCTECCGPIEVSKTEAKRMGMGDRRCTHFDKDFNCEFKTATGCSIYDRRPFVCRIMGTGDDHSPMRCHIRREAGYPEGTLTAEQTEYLTYLYFTIMREEGVTQTDENVLFALKIHDERAGFDSLTDGLWDHLKTLDPTLEDRFERWKSRHCND